MGFPVGTSVFGTVPTSLAVLCALDAVSRERDDLRREVKMLRERMHIEATKAFNRKTEIEEMARRLKQERRERRAVERECDEWRVKAEARGRVLNGERFRRRSGEVDACATSAGSAG